MWEFENITKKNRPGGSRKVKRPSEIMETSPGPPRGIAEPFGGRSGHRTPQRYTSTWMKNGHAQLAGFRTMYAGIVLARSLEGEPRGYLLAFRRLVSKCKFDATDATQKV